MDNFVFFYSAEATTKLHESCSDVGNTAQVIKPFDEMLPKVKSFLIHINEHIK
jgi:hypothetical protein